jgi:hypothetical protein
VGGNTGSAVRLSVRNILLAESLYGVLPRLEASLRNPIYVQLATDYGRAEWYDTLNLEPEQDAMLRKTKDILEKGSLLMRPGGC